MIKSKSISLNHLIVQGKGNVVSDMDGEKVMMSISNGKYYNLGGIGGVIWDLIKKPITVNQLITTLMSEYVVEQKKCEEQVMTFLKHLNEEGLIYIEE